MKLDPAMGVIPTNPLDTRENAKRGWITFALSLVVIFLRNRPWVTGQYRTGFGPLNELLLVLAGSVIAAAVTGLLAYKWRNLSGKSVVTFRCLFGLSLLLLIIDIAMWENVKQKPLLAQLLSVAAYGLMSVSLCGAVQSSKQFVKKRAPMFAAYTVGVLASFIIHFVISAISSWPYFDTIRVPGSFEVFLTSLRALAITAAFYAVHAPFTTSVRWKTVSFLGIATIVFFLAQCLAYYGPRGMESNIRIVLLTVPSIALTALTTLFSISVGANVGQIVAFKLLPEAPEYNPT